MPLVMEFLLKERITQIHTFQNACDGGYSRVCLARVRVRQRLKRITKLVGGCLLNCRQNIRPIVPNVDYVCCAYAICLTDSDIDCRNLKGRCFYEPAGRIAHNSNGATQPTVVRLRAKIIDHFPHTGIRLNPLPHAGCDNASGGIGVWHRKDHRKTSLIERSQKLIGLPFDLLVFEDDGMKCYEEKWPLHVNAEAIDFAIASGVSDESSISTRSAISNPSFSREHTPNPNSENKCMPETYNFTNVWISVKCLQ